jgi:hypothetical protein
MSDKVIYFSSPGGASPAPNPAAAFRMLVMLQQFERLFKE